MQMLLQHSQPQIQHCHVVCDVRTGAADVPVFQAVFLAGNDQHWVLDIPLTSLA